MRNLGPTRFEEIKQTLSKNCTNYQITWLKDVLRFYWRKRLHNKSIILLFRGKKSNWNYANKKHLLSYIKPIELLDFLISLKYLNWICNIRTWAFFSKSEWMDTQLVNLQCSMANEIDIKLNSTFAP